MAAAVDVSGTGLRAMFSMLTPNESSFETVQEVPQYVQQATPYFIGLMLLELLVGALKMDTPIVTIGDGLTSISCGMISRLPQLFFRGFEMSTYMFVWEKYSVLELPWDSPWTWWSCLLGVDLCYYWVHRFAHGTFAEESEKVIYGLVYPIKTFEIFYIQLHYYLYLWKKSTYYTTITHKILTFLNGPSWKPGKPRLGDHVDNPKVTGSERPHDSRWALPLQLYVVLHFLLLLVTYHNLFDSKTMLSQITIFSMTCYILLTLTSLGFIIDQRASAALLEMLRCIVMVTMLRYNVLTVPLLPLLPWATQAFVALSLLLWLLQCTSQLVIIKSKMS